MKTNIHIFRALRMYGYFMLVVNFIPLLSVNSLFFERSSHPIIELLRQQYHQSIVNVPMVSGHNVFIQESIVEPEKPHVASLEVRIADIYEVMKTDFHTALERFQALNDYGEIALQNIVDLIDLELLIIKNLMRGRTGAAVERALEKRNNRLKMSTPSVLYVYDKIFDIAAHDEQYNRMMYVGCRKGRNLEGSLRRYDQKAFLISIKNKFEDYRKTLKKLQYSIAINMTPALLEQNQ